MFVTPSDSFEKKIISSTVRYLSDSGFKRLKSKVLPPRSVLVTCIGSAMGKIGINKNECITNQQINSIKINKKKFDSDYIYYCLRNNSKLIRNAATGSTAVPILNKTDFESLKLKIHENIFQQQQIASVLSSLDSKIELNNRINHELEQMAKLLYDYWFVQFEFPDKAGKPYKTSGGKMVWNEELKREIPEGWKMKRLDEIADLKAGGDKPQNYSEIQTDTHQIPIFSNGITNDGLYGFTDEAKILKPSITVSARGTIGYCVMRNKPFVPIIRLIVVTPNSSYEAKFLYERIKSMEFDNSGSVQQQLTVPQISGVKVVMPSSEILKKYYALTSAGMKKN